MQPEIAFAWIPPGRFTMGGDGIADNPPREVAISKGFHMGIHPVTQAQWLSVTGDNPSCFLGDDRPVEMVSWLDAQDFCAKLAGRTGKPILLPTEAEWEYACRAGSTTEYCNGNGAESLAKVGWFEGNSGKQTMPVGLLAPNAWGLYDMHGNVPEWCEDWYGPLDSGDRTDPVQMQKNFTDYRVHRGGCWFDAAGNCRSAFRARNTPANRCDYFGFGLRVCYRLD